MTHLQSYKTRQRRLILNYLANNRNRYLTAEEIRSYFCTEGTHVGKSTVYRYLNLLLEKGLIRKYLRSNRVTCYQYIGEEGTKAPLCHLKCERCGKSEEISCQEIQEVSTVLENQWTFKLNLQQTIFYGQCRECQEMRF
ncbi:MAG: transcriptional repressor [Turicibacter sp.]|nr:transcriptional repressor [Turicibacter sp.]